MSKRNSGVDLLRIVCIFMIIFHHSSVHGFTKNFFANLSFRDISFNVVFFQSIGMFGRMSCMIFAIITGYYMIRMDDDTKVEFVRNGLLIHIKSIKSVFYRRLIPIVITLLMYSAFSYIFLLLIHYDNFNYDSYMKAFSRLFMETTGI